VVSAPGDGSAEWGDGVSDCAAVGGVLGLVLDPPTANCRKGKDPAKGYFFTANADRSGVSDGDKPARAPAVPQLHWDDSSGFAPRGIEQMIGAIQGARQRLRSDDMMAIPGDHVSRARRGVHARHRQIMVTASSPPEIAARQSVLNQWATNGWGLPVGSARQRSKNSPVDSNATVVQIVGCFLFHRVSPHPRHSVFTTTSSSPGSRSQPAADQDTEQLDARSRRSWRVVRNDVDARAVRVATKTCLAQVTTALVQRSTTLSSQVGSKRATGLGPASTRSSRQPAALVTNDFRARPVRSPRRRVHRRRRQPRLSAPGPTQYGSGASAPHLADGFRPSRS